jgi:hypothetical protein
MPKTEPQESIPRMEGRSSMHPGLTGAHRPGGSQKWFPDGTPKRQESVRE